MSTKTKLDLAMGVKRVPGGWVLATYQIKDGKVVKETQTVPDNRALALEALRREMTRFWDEDVV